MIVLPRIVLDRRQGKTPPVRESSGGIANCFAATALNLHLLSKRPSTLRARLDLLAYALGTDRRSISELLMAAIDIDHPSHI